MTVKYIKPSNILRLPGLTTYLCWWVILDHFGAPGWLYGLIYTLMGIGTLAAWGVMFFGRSVDVLAGK